MIRQPGQAHVGPSALRVSKRPTKRIAGGPLGSAEPSAPLEPPLLDAPPLVDVPLDPPSEELSVEPGGAAFSSLEEQAIASATAAAAMGKKRMFLRLAVQNRYATPRCITSSPSPLAPPSSPMKTCRYAAEKSKRLSTRAVTPAEKPMRVPDIASGASAPPSAARGVT